MREFIENEIKKLKEEKNEIDEMYEDFNPSDWSGGNFDDAYEIGLSHGETLGRLSLLHVIVGKTYELEEKLSVANSLLLEAHDLMDDTHCYDTKIYHAISKYFNGDEEDEDS